MLRSTISGSGGSGSQTQQNITEIIHLLESTSISVTEQTAALVRDSLSSNSDPWLFNGLIDHYISSGNAIIRKLLLGIRQPQHKNFLVKLDEYLQKPSTRYAALNLLGHVVRKEPTWLHHIVQSRAFTTVIKCLQLDNDIAVLTIAMYVMSTLLPKLPTQIAPSLNHLFGIFIRLVSWRIIRVVDASEFNVCNFNSALYSFFLCLYGMYPCNFVECLQNYYCKKKSQDGKTNGTPALTHATSPGEEQVLMERKRYKIFESAIVPMLQRVRLHPNMIMYTKELEIMNEKWRKMETHDIVVDISQITVEETDQIPAEISISKSSNVQVGSSPVHRTIDTLQSESFSKNMASLTSDETIWSPSMVIGLSTPPSSRGISPTRELLDDAKSRSNSSEKSKSKLRPDTLSLSHSSMKSASNLSTPCTPTLQSLSFEYEKSDSDQELVATSRPGLVLTPKEVGPDRSSSSTPTKFTFRTGAEVLSPSKSQTPISEFSPALQPLEDHLLSQKSQEDSNKRTSDTLFIETDKPTIKDILKLADGDLSSSKPSSEILEREMRLTIQADKNRYTSDIDWQHFGQGALSEKDSKSLLSGYLQMQCALLFEQHRRQQHATKARRLMRKIYESSALAEKNNTMEEILAQKEREIGRLQALVKTMKSERMEVDTKHRLSTEALKHELSRTSNLLKATKEENERLAKEKSLDEIALETMMDEKKHLIAELNKCKLELDYETRNKEANQELRAQVIKLQKELLIVEEVHQKLEGLQKNESRFKVTKTAEYEMIIRSYKKENSKLKEEFLKVSRRCDMESAKALQFEQALRKKDKLLDEQKKCLENVKSLARSQIQAIEAKYQAQKNIVTQMEIQIMELYAKLSAIEGQAEAGIPIGQSGGKAIQKSLESTRQQQGHTLSASPELSPPIQMSMLDRATVATLELEASTATD